MAADIINAADSTSADRRQRWTVKFPKNEIIARKANVDPKKVIEGLSQQNVV